MTQMVSTLIEAFLSVDLVQYTDIVFVSVFASVGACGSTIIVVGSTVAHQPLEQRQVFHDLCHKE
jgi:hypothetical protein